jgi:hypothetical protein
MAEDRVDDEGSYATDEAGIRRWIAPGDEVPQGWVVEDAPASEAPKRPPAKK